MKIGRRLLAICLLAALCMGFAAQARGEIVIDVVNGYLQTGGYRIFLARNVEKPIAVGLSGSDVVLYVATGIGNTELNLGPGKVSVTERAVAYVQVKRDPTEAPSAAPTGTPGTAKATASPATAAPLAPSAEKTSVPLSAEDLCPRCKKPLAVGDHSKLRCGHYVCVVGKEHFRICDTCNHYLCNRVNHDKCPVCGVGYCRHTCGYVPPDALTK